jgi:heme-degrading monooxygenase HmoA
VITSDRRRAKMPEHTDEKVFAVIVVAEVDQEESQTALAGMKRWWEEHVSREPGFRGAELFAEEGGAQVVMVQRWAEREDYVRFRQSEEGFTKALEALKFRPKTFFTRLVVSVK